MKLVIDERVKHRLIGLAVILSIGAIFAPAIMKKSNQRIDGNVGVTVQLPPKPEQPSIDMVEKKVMFDSVKVAHIELPLPEEEQPPARLAHNEKSANNELAGKTLALADEEQNLNSSTFANQNLTEAQPAPASMDKHKRAVARKIAKGLNYLPTAESKQKRLAKINRPTPAAKPLPQKISKNAPRKQLKRGYTVQLATFSQQRNADTLISRLKGKGYNATFNKIKTNNGLVYKVMVGQVNRREQAQALREQLASAVQIKGFIVSMDEG